MLDRKNAENAKTNICKKCNFKCCKQSDYDRHLMTAKHKMLDDAVIKHAKNATPCVCICGKGYKHNQSYYRHKKKCETYLIQENNPSDLEVSLKYQEKLPNSYVLKHYYDKNQASVLT